MNQGYVTPMTPLDEMVSDGNLQMLKASMPYLPGSGQRFLSFYTKFLELKHTVDLFSRSGTDMTACEVPSSPSANPVNMLNDIRRFCDPSTQKNIDQIMNMMVMVQMMEVMKENG
ncbi:MAG: hypothetical protein ACLRVB_12365 [Blautia sp.]